jgi:hypothetical protein
MASIPRPPRIRIDTSRIASQMLKRDRGDKMAGIILSIVGLFLLPLGPMLVGTFTWALTTRNNHPTLAGWITNVAVCSLFVIPIGFFVARSGAGEVIGDAADRFNDANLLARRNRAGQVILVASCVMGPGVMWYAIRKLIAASRFRGVSRQRAADVLGKLFIRNEGTDVFELLAPGEKLDQLLPTLEYLCHHDWIGANKDGDRVWASSESQNRLGIKPL